MSDIANSSRTSIGAGVARTRQPFRADPEAFRFVIVGDRTGGHRPGVFEDAMEKVNLLQPDFVVNVGDLIEGYTDDAATLDVQWEEIEGFLDCLQMPFFYVPGNHDLSNSAMTRHWQQRHGDTYYHFVYNDVLFLVLNTEDPPVVLPDDIVARQRNLEAAMAADPEATQEHILEISRNSPERGRLPGGVAMSEAQLAFVAETLSANTDVRWTMVLLHKPAWLYDSPEFLRVEGLLGDRPYSVVAGHEHYYAYDSRFGRDYIDMGATGGVWLRDGPGRLDHIAWVTMAAKGPMFANIRVEGIFDKYGVRDTTTD